MWVLIMWRENPYGNSDNRQYNRQISVGWRWQIDSALPLAHDLV
jgi:hypothetical protein